MGKRKLAQIDDTLYSKWLDEAVRLPSLSNHEESLKIPQPKYTPSTADIEEIEHTIINLSYMLDTLLNKFRWLEQWDLDTLACSEKSALNSEAYELLTKYRVRMACEVVKKYWKDGIPVFDNILTTRSPNQGDTSSTLHIKSGQLDMSQLDKLQNLVLQASLNSIKTLRQRVQGDEEFFGTTQRAIEDLKMSSAAGSIQSRDNCGTQENSNATATTEHSQSVQDWPPSLPEITNQELLSQVLTHKSTTVLAHLESEASVLRKNNERLEFKGDSILDFVICDLLYSEFPHDNEGKLSAKKSSLVCNDTLFDFAVIYKLHERLRISSDMQDKVYKNPGDKLPDSKNKNKAIADVFEAYIGGLALDRGLKITQDWLIKLYEPFIAELKINANTEEDVNKNAKNELYRKVGSAEQPITYKQLNHTQPFTVACLINGEEVGRGTDKSLKSAGLRAATMVLRDHALIERFAAKRREIPRTAPSTARSGHA